MKTATCLRTVGCPKPNGHKGKCSTRCCTASRTPDSDAPKEVQTFTPQIQTEFDTATQMPFVNEAQVLRIIDDDDAALAGFFN